jgi:hypothetical protein
MSITFAPSVKTNATFIVCDSSAAVAYIGNNRAHNARHNGATDFVMTADFNGLIFMFTSVVFNVAIKVKRLGYVRYGLLNISYHRTFP